MSPATQVLIGVGLGIVAVPLSYGIARRDRELADL